MKIYDDVMVIIDKETYSKNGVFKGMVGYICMPEIRDESFMVCFTDENFKKHENDPEWLEAHYDELEDDKFAIIKIEDLKLVRDRKTSNESILNELPKHNPKWWCLVEDGYIMNLLGERKNKIPFDYNS